MAKKRKNLLDGFLYVLNTLVAFALLASYLNKYVSPAFISWFAFLGLAYQYLLIANLLFAVWWALRMKIKIVLPVFAILIGYWQVPSYFKLSGTNQVVPREESLKVISYNVHNLNVSNWLEEENVPQKIYALLENEDPDLVLLQEFNRLREEIKVNFPYRYEEVGPKAGNAGQVIYSKHPILDQGYFELPVPEGAPKNKMIWVDIEWKGIRTRVFNLHLHSVGLGKKYYENLESLAQKDQEEIQDNLSVIGGNLKRAFEQRAVQVDFVDSILKIQELPLIFGGDFNEPPNSYSYHNFSKQVSDSYISAGEGWQYTFDNTPFPFRLDYIFYSDEDFSCHHYEVLKEKLSDHYPVIAEFKRP